jgi:hypothetical protein
MKQRPDPSTKPYYECFSCPQFRKDCGGLPTRGMPLKEWCEYICDVKEIIRPRPSNAFIAEQASVSIKTVEKIMAINCDQDIMRATARQIELAVIGPVTNCLCCMKHNNNTALLEEIAELRAELARKNKIIDKFLG